MSEQPLAAFTKTSQTINARVLAECRKTYGSMVDDSVIQAWVSASLSNLLTEQTRVTQFITVLAMRDIRDRASTYISPEAA